MKYIISFLVFVIFILTALVAYFLGKQSSQVSSAVPLVKNSVAIISPTLTPSIPQETPKPTQTIKGGGILSFPHYQLQASSDWIYSREAQGQDNEKIILKNGDYGISIIQGGFGGAVCLFPGDADTEGPSSRYTQFVEITTKSGDQFRRSTPENSQGFGICQHTQYGWGAPSLYGHIGLTIPSNSTEEMLKQIDKILASFEKI